MNTPEAAEGSGYIFVIHYAYWQPEAQSFGSLPNAFGQTAPILSNSSAAPATFAVVPEGGNGTYVVNTKVGIGHTVPHVVHAYLLISLEQTNITQAYPGPPISDATARYGASTTTLLQVTGDGSLAYLDLASGNQTWTSIDLSAFNQTSTMSTTTGVPSSTSAATAAAGAAGPNNAAPSTKATGAAGLSASPLVTLYTLLLSTSLAFISL